MRGEVVFVCNTTPAHVVTNNAVQRIFSTRARSDSTMGTDLSVSNPALSLLRDWIFKQRGSGRVLNGTFTTEGSFRMVGRVSLVSEFLGLRRQ